jgi:hypothetical protein
MNKYTLSVLLISLALIFLPFFWRQPFPYAFESAQHLRTCVGFAHAFADDPGFPDWFAVPFAGRGVPLFRFLGPLPNFLASLFMFMGAPVHIAAKLTVLFFFLLGFIGSWHLCDRTEQKFKPAFLLILANPYIVLFLHFAFQFQNVCAYFLFPLIALGLQKIARQEKYGWHILSLTIGFMAYTHLQTTLLTFYASLLFGLIYLRNRQPMRYRPLLLVILAAGFSFFFAAPYIVPALGTMNDTVFNDACMPNLEPGGKITPFLDNPLIIENMMTRPVCQGFGLIFTYLSFDFANRKDLYLLNSGSRFEHFRPWLMLLSFLLFGIGLLAFYKRDNSSAEKTMLLAGLIFLTMAFSPSKFLWDLLPGLHYVQFPWRVIFLASTMILSGANRFLIEMFAKNPLKTGAALIIPWVWLIFIFTLPGKPWPEGLLDAYLKKGTYPLFLSNVLPKYRNLSEQSGQPHRFTVLSNGQTFAPAESGNSWAKYRFENLSKPIPVNILTHYDLYWRMKKIPTNSYGPPENEEILLTPNEDGTMLVTLPAGSYTLSLYRLRPKGRTAGYLFFLLSSGFWLASVRKTRQA